MKPAKKITLSKSSFIRGLQCPKSLYLYKYSYSLRDKLSPETLSKFSRGHHVGLLAQQLFPDGINMKPFSPQQYAHAPERTKAKILEGANTIYEAAFSHNDVTVFLDILHFRDGGWHACEVKSSAEVSETFIMDASLQYYVIENSGIDLQSFEIIYLNKDYIRKEKLEIHKLFTFQNVLNEVKKNMLFIQDKVEEFKTMLGRKEVPEIKVGSHCHYPYTCDFIGHCWKEIMKQRTVFLLPSFTEEEKYKMHCEERILLNEIKIRRDLSEIQELQIEYSIMDKEYYDNTGLKKFISGIHYPALAVEMISVRSAIPLRSNTRPYQPVPFMFCAASISEEGKDRNSNCFFLENISGNVDGLYKDIYSLLDDAPSVLVYGKAAFLYSLQTLVEDGFLNQKQLKSFDEKIIDLKDIFSMNLYFNPSLSGNTDLSNLARCIFKMRISRDMVPSDVIASDMYVTLQSETDMFHIVEVKEKLNEYAAFNLDVIRRFYSFIQSKTLA